MRVLAWNLNHRAAQRRIPGWISKSVASYNPDAAIFTEYVHGDDHECFLEELGTQGLLHASLTQRPPGENQLLIVSRAPHSQVSIVAPPIHSSVQPNVIHVALNTSGLQIVGFRMPAFTGPGRTRLKRLTWDWLLSVAAELRNLPCVIAGDFNTAPDDGTASCGEYFQLLSSIGWHLPPAVGYSWRHPRSGATRRIDHALLSPRLAPGRAEYSWKFHDLAPDASSGKVGLADHAMLLVEVGQILPDLSETAQAHAAAGSGGLSPYDLEPS